MNICEYAILFCPKTGASCSHKKCMEECGLAKISSDHKLTFADCLSIYSDCAGVSEKRSSSVCNTVIRALSLIGLDATATTDSMTYRRFKEIIAAMENHHVCGKEYSKETISAMLSSFKSICKESLRDEYENRGFVRPMFDIPRYSVPRKKVVAMSVEQSAKVTDWMRRLSVSKDRMEQAMFIALWFERLFAVRPGDINRLTWDCIRHDGSKTSLVYKPNKTKDCEGRDDPIVIPPDLYYWIAPFVKPGEPLIPRMRRARKEISRNRAMWNRINSKFREWGICDASRNGKASYINRRQRITEAFNKDGFKGAMAMGKNTPKVQIDHYISIGEYVA